MESREEYLSHLKSYIDGVDKEVTMILQSLQWDRKHLLESPVKVPCKYEANHEIPPDKKVAHEAACLLKRNGYSDEDKLLPEPADNNAATLVKLSIDEIAQIINKAAQDDPSFKRGEGSAGVEPLSLERLQCAYSADERRAIHDAVVSAAPSTEHVDLVIPGNSTQQPTRAKSRLQVLAELRDMKRRRAKYKVSVNCKNYSHALRDVITTQMELYCEAIGVKTPNSNNEKSNETTQDNIQKQIRNKTANKPEHSRHSNKPEHSRHSNKPEHSSYKHKGQAKEYDRGKNRHENNDGRKDRTGGNEDISRYNKEAKVHGDHLRHNKEPRGHGDHTRYNKEARGHDGHLRYNKEARKHDDHLRYNKEARGHDDYLRYNKELRLNDSHLRYNKEARRHDNYLRYNKDYKKDRDDSHNKSGGYVLDREIKREKDSCDREEPGNYRQKVDSRRKDNQYRYGNLMKLEDKDINVRSKQKYRDSQSGYEEQRRRKDFGGASHEDYDIHLEIKQEKSEDSYVDGKRKKY